MIHPDIREFFDYSLVRQQRDGVKTCIKAYPLKEFVETTVKKVNLHDMEIHTGGILASFKSKL